MVTETGQVRCLHLGGDRMTDLNLAALEAYL